MGDTLRVEDGNGKLEKVIDWGDGRGHYNVGRESIHSINMEFSKIMSDIKLSTYEVYHLSTCLGGGKGKYPSLAEGRICMYNGKYLYNWVWIGVSSRVFKVWEDISENEFIQWVEDALEGEFK